MGELFIGAIKTADVTPFKGDRGIQGDKGDKGDQGIQGVKGDTGTSGAKGDTGLQGIQGVKGDIGNPTVVGAPIAGNANGATITGNVLSLANATASTAGILTPTAQSIGGLKNFTDLTTFSTGFNVLDTTGKAQVSTIVSVSAPTLTFAATSTDTPQQTIQNILVATYSISSRTYNVQVEGSYTQPSSATTSTVISWSPLDINHSCVGLAIWHITDSTNRLGYKVGTVSTTMTSMQYTFPSNPSIAALPSFPTTTPLVPPGTSNSSALKLANPILWGAGAGPAHFMFRVGSTQNSIPAKTPGAYVWTVTPQVAYGDTGCVTMTSTTLLVNRPGYYSVSWAWNFGLSTTTFITEQHITFGTGTSATTGFGNNNFTAAMDTYVSTARYLGTLCATLFLSTGQNLFFTVYNNNTSSYTPPNGAGFLIITKLG